MERVNLKKVRQGLKTYVLLLNLFTLLFTLSFYSYGQDEDLNDVGYATVNAGIGYIPKIGLINHNTALNIGLAMGVKSHAIRYEGEFGYLQASNHSFVGQVNAFKLMLNTYYDFDKLAAYLESGFIPYVGVGIGWGHISHSAPEDALEGHTVETIGTLKQTINRSVFAYQGFAGWSYILTPNLASRVFYNYLGTSRPKGFDKIFQQQSINVGFSYYFN